MDSPDFGTLNYAILIAYLIVSVGIGCLFAGKQRTTEDYFLAGRNMPWLVVGMSMFASLSSAISYLGIPGTAYKENISLLMMAVISPIVAPFLIIVFYPFYRALHVTTSYEYILQRYGQQARFTVAVLFLLARLGWLGAVLYAPAMTLSVVTGIDLSVAILAIVSLLLFVGLGLFAYYHSFPNALVEEIRGDRVLPYYIIHTLPPGVSGLLITAIFAAAMSSIDSGINSMTTVVVTDLVKPLRTICQTEQHDITLARMLTLLLGSLATGVAFYVSEIEQIVKASSAFLGLFAGPILALFLLGMLTRRANFHGWLAGVLTAIPATIWLQHGTNVHFVYYFPFCFAISGCVGYVASVVVDVFGGGSTAGRNLTIWDRQWPS